MDWAQSGNKLSCRLTQSTSNPSVSFYELDVPVRFFGKGSDTTLVLNHSYSGQEYTFDVPFVIDSVSIDPELWLISGNNTSRNLPSLKSNDFIEIYPNPIADVMTIWYDSRDLNQLSYSIWDMQGKKVMEHEVTATGDRYSVNLAGLDGGVYIVRISGSGRTMTQRIVKY